ncbi:unnamed protein product [Brassica oleracea]
MAEEKRRKTKHNLWKRDQSLFTRQTKEKDLLGFDLVPNRIQGKFEFIYIEFGGVENTKEVVGTSLVSKRWRSLWKLVPRLDASSSDLINNFLTLSKAPVLETLHLRLDENSYEPEENERWVSIAAARQVRDLELRRYGFRRTSMLPCPRSLFTCKGPVVLCLQQVSICDIPSTVFLQTLKTLSLVCVRFVSGDGLVHRLLSACPILETLTVCRWSEDGVTTFAIAIPSLQNLYIMQRPDSDGLEYDCEYVVNAPALKTLKVLDKFGHFRSLVKMPKLVKAEIKIRQEDSEKLMGCLTSAKHLSLCLTSAATTPKSFEFLCQVEYLELCTNCSSDWLSLVLRHSPKLRVLRLSRKNCGMFRECVPQWDFEAQRGFEIQWEKPCYVPECLVSSLESVEWIGYRGTEAEKEAAIYILDKSKHLKKMTLYRKITNLREKYRTLIDLKSRMSCGSTCRLEFVPL